jgi:hypothetical protein
MTLAFVVDVGICLKGGNWFGTKFVNMWRSCKPWNRKIELNFPWKTTCRLVSLSEGRVINSDSHRALWRSISQVQDSHRKGKASSPGSQSNQTWILGSTAIVRLRLIVKCYSGLWFMDGVLLLSEVRWFWFWRGDWFKSQNEVEEWEVISKKEGFPSLSDARPPFKFSSTLFIMARIEQDVFLFLM